MSATPKPDQRLVKAPASHFRANHRVFSSPLLVLCLQLSPLQVERLRVFVTHHIPTNDQLPQSISIAILLYSHHHIRTTSPLLSA